MTEKPEIVKIPGRWDISYQHAAGEVGSEFLRRLRDEKRVCGLRCSKCRRVMAPPRAFCERCFVRAEEWVDIGPGGRIEAFTITTEPFEGLPGVPCAIAYATLDGATTAMVNFVKRVDLSDLEQAAEKLAIGTRIKIAWKPRRRGRITDFYYIPGTHRR